MGTRRIHPTWVEIEAITLPDGRRASIMRFPTSTDEHVEIVMSLATLGKLTAEADAIRETAMAWG